MSRNDTERAMRLVAALWRFWHIRGYEPEARRRIGAVLEADGRPSKARAFALIGLSVMVAGQGDLDAGRQLAGDALDLYSTFDDAWGVAYATETLGFISSYDDRERARALLEESVERFRQIGDVHFELLAASNLAWVYTELGDAERGAALHEDILVRAREAGDSRLEAGTLQSLAYHAVDGGALRKATVMLREALVIHRDMGELPAISLDLLTLARVLLVGQQPASAAMMLGRMRGLAEESGTPVEEAYAAEYEAAAQAQLGQAAYADATERGRSMSIDEAIAAGFEAAEELRS
jgi:tetratricopeptide (TPR) repeat protein